MGERITCLCPASIVLLVLNVYNPVSGDPIVWRKLLYEQLRTHKVITKDEIVVVCFFLNYQHLYFKSVLEAPRRGDSYTDAQLMINVTIL